MIVGKCKTLSAIVNINVNSLNDLFLQSNYLQFVISKQPATDRDKSYSLADEHEKMRIILEIYL